MKLFGFNISKSKPDIVQETQVPDTRDGAVVSSAFSTAFGKVGSANLSLPYINSTYTGAQGYVRFGDDNLYPQLLNQLYYSAPLVRSIIDFTVNASIGGGYKYTNESMNIKQQTDLLAFEKINDWDNLIEHIAKDIKLHDRVTLIFKYDKQGNFLKVERKSPASIRHHEDNKKFDWSPDWSRMVGQKTYCAFDKSKKEQEQLFLYQGDAQDTWPYAIPAWATSANWAFLSGEYSFLQKQNIINSIFLSMIVKRPKKFASDQEAQAYFNGFKEKKGAKSTGTVVILAEDSKDLLPEIDFPETNNNDKLFNQTSKDMNENICYSFMINPSIMGLKVAGSLGNAQELQMSYAIWEKNNVLPLRKKVERVLNTILSEAKIETKIVLNNYQIIDGAIQNTTTK